MGSAAKRIGNGFLIREKLISLMTLESLSENTYAKYRREKATDKTLTHTIIKVGKAQAPAESTGHFCSEQTNLPGTGQCKRFRLRSQAFHARASCQRPKHRRR